METKRLLMVIVAVIIMGMETVVLAQDGRSCEVKAIVETVNSSTTGANGMATVRITEGQAPYKYIFYDNATGKQLQKDLSRHSINNLTKGEYYCIVADNKGCIKKIQFQIQ